MMAVKLDFYFNCIKEMCKIYEDLIETHIGDLILFLREKSLNFNRKKWICELQKMSPLVPPMWLIFIVHSSVHGHTYHSRAMMKAMIFVFQQQKLEPFKPSWFIYNFASLIKPKNEASHTHLRFIELLMLFSISLLWLCGNNFTDINLINFQRSSIKRFWRQLIPYVKNAHVN